MTHNVQIEERPEQPYAGTTRLVTMDTIARIADRIPVLIGWLAERGITPAGAPFLKYETVDMANGLEITAGVPVATPIEAEGDVHAATLPAGRYATITHAGHPDGLLDATSALLDWAKREGLAWDVKGDRWAARLEVYRTNPLEVPDPNGWVTEIAIKLA
jgi:effector-binding domain-containing protein